MFIPIATVFFILNHGEWNGKFDKIKIHTTIEGAKLRYRAAYARRRSVHLKLPDLG